MPITGPIGTGTVRDVPVMPDDRVRYEPLAPKGLPHSVYRVKPVKAQPRKRKRD